ncbi:unnamed protein product [Effrenium voratum]|uniref:Uncharacterized protein n=1 Tax=Effrenium voratum TaxID=2562239 RepID=A0AA36N4S3_9DINO|nr:unnamed protein product [Effrenium voratum]CAJ1423961.1 unnamed protein product [Effrenium voratum]
MEASSSLRECSLGPAESARPSTAPPRLAGDAVGPPATPPPAHAAARPPTAPSVAGPMIPSIENEGLQTWCRVYARSVNFSNLPLTPQGALMAKHILPMPPKRVGDIAPAPPEIESLQAIVCAVRLSPQRVEATDGTVSAPTAELLVTFTASTTVVASGRLAPSVEDPKFFFQDKKTPKLPVLALPTAAGALVPGQEPKWLEERWSRGTLCEDAFKLRDSHKDKDYYPIYDYDSPSTASVAATLAF